MSPDGDEASPEPSAQSYRDPPDGHLLLSYRGEQPPWQPVVSFLSAGLAAHRRLLWLYDETAPAELDERLRRANLDVGELRASGQLRVRAVENHYLEGSRFEPDRVAEKLRTALKEALRDGFTGLQVVGEAGQAAHALSAEKLVAYERRVQTLLTEESAYALCLYPADRFDDAVLNVMSRIHGNELDASDRAGQGRQRAAVDASAAATLSRETTFRSMPEALFHVRWPEGLIQACNPAAEAFTGYDRGHLVGALLDRLFRDDEQSNAFRRRLGQALERDAPARISFPIERADGQERPAEHVLRPLIATAPEEPIPALLLMREETDEKAR